MYEDIEYAKRVPAVFYDAGIICYEDWLYFVKAAPCWVVRCDHPERGPVGMWWLNGFQGRTAMIHFCMFDVLSLKDNIEMGRQGLKWLQSLDTLDSLYGLTPKPYRNVWPFIEALGFKKQGALQGACHMAYYDKYVDGVISTLNLSMYKE